MIVRQNVKIIAYAVTTQLFSLTWRNLNFFNNRVIRVSHLFTHILLSDKFLLRIFAFITRYWSELLFLESATSYPKNLWLTCICPHPTHQWLNIKKLPRYENFCGLFHWRTVASLRLLSMELAYHEFRVKCRYILSEAKMDPRIKIKRLRIRRKWKPWHRN